MSSSIAETRAASPAASVSRLLVTVRAAAPLHSSGTSSSARLYRPVGFLTHVSGAFWFAYLQRETTRRGFRPLPGLGKAVDRPMQSSSLFPIFAERVISSRRPDRRASLEALGLPPDAAPFEVLVRSHGQRVGDTIELLPVPDISAGGRVSFTFLAHGVRHLPEMNQERIGFLTAGARLMLIPEPNNEVNPRAQLVTDTDALALGWLPDPLINVVNDLLDRELSVERANGPEVGFHFRLLVRINGRVAHGRQLFDGPEWDTVGDVPKL